VRHHRSPGWSADARVSHRMPPPEECPPRLMPPRAQASGILAWAVCHLHHAPPSTRRATLPLPEPFHPSPHAVHVCRVMSWGSWRIQDRTGSEFYKPLYPVEVVGENRRSCVLCLRSMPAKDRGDQAHTRPTLWAAIPRIFLTAPFFMQLLIYILANARSLCAIENAPPV
jgi:hypothetical protein